MSRARQVAEASRMLDGWLDIDESERGDRCVIDDVLGRLLAYSFEGWSRDGLHALLAAFVANTPDISEIAAHVRDEHQSLEHHREVLRVERELVARTGRDVSGDEIEAEMESQTLLMQGAH